MTLGEKIDELSKDIQETIVEDDNAIEYYPLPEKIKQLAECFNVSDVKNNDFINWVKATPMHNIKECIRLCNEKIPKNTPNLRYKEQSIKQIKYLANNAIWWFKKGCKDLNIDILDNKVE
jgi:hypothetical protein